MVISNIIGGLGNQMFQYAAGRALSIKCGSNLQLDISGFANYELHQGFELQRIFNCNTEIASKSNVRNVLGWQSLSFVRRIILRSNMQKLRCKPFVVEPHFYYWSGIRNLTEDCYLYGYWQSENYFVDVAARIREDFTFKLPMQNNNAELAVHINNVNAVSLHVRRGDYVNNTTTYALCSSDYYKAAIEYIAGRVEQPHFYIFSDDIAWVKNNLKIDFPHHYVDCNHGSESYNDMRLMSLCKHNIIANSSFSWWGAWLNSSSKKIVVAPKYWFANETNIQDLMPEGWVRL
ncbi:alpha-1,2-fucosyltransferase [Methylotenera sp. L2L1]|uniref:alpha-1,2-fucosyltransferase n=1 Tax=Methylotenera sp. L2L1 TaxID=1502770 RepID=UPI00055DC006|nr:alpha-1,2-fucosyltransferase [Methylotenera sp. L2L1]